MKRQYILSFCLLTFFLVSWMLYRVEHTHNHPPVYIQQLNSFEDNSGSMALDKEYKKLPFTFDHSQKYNETLNVLLLLLVFCSALILHHRRRLFLGPIFHQSNNIIHLFCLNDYDSNQNKRGGNDGSFSLFDDWSIFCRSNTIICFSSHLCLSSNFRFCSK
jgi:hypothetical protein